MQKTKEQIGKEFWERLEKYIIKDERPYSWCSRVGINKGAFQSAYNRRAKPLDKTVDKWAKKIGVDYVWLNTGKGSPYPSQTNKTVAKAETYRPVADWDDDTPLDADEVDISFYKNLHFACGDGALAQVLSDEAGKLRMARSTLNKRGIQPSNVIAATASDNSMRPTINSGATLFIDLGRNTIKDGKIFAIEHGGLFRCKRLYALPKGGVRITSDNSDEYPSIHLTAQQQIDEEFCIIGWVFSWSVVETW